MTLNDIQYGNPAQDVLEFLNGQSFLNGLYAELSQFAFPANDSNNTREELNLLVELTNTLQRNKDLAYHYFDYDDNLYTWFRDRELFEDEKKAEEYRNTVTSIFQDCLPLIYMLKSHHNRPRPFQLAGYHKLRLFPYHSFSVNTASFPSLYACISSVLCDVLGNHYPGDYKLYMELKKDIASSRLYMGLNYQSDVDAGIIVAGKILANKEFKVKYKL